MRVLFLGDSFDYLQNMTFHGLRSVLGNQLIDYPRLDSAYVDYFPQKNKLHGQGFTIAALLPDISIDRMDIPQKLESNYFDAVVVANLSKLQKIYYSNGLQDHLDRVRRLIVLDGRDELNISTFRNPSVLYFKRELYVSSLNERYDILPISFSFPIEKACLAPVTKTQWFSSSKPDTPFVELKADTSYYVEYLGNKSRDFKYIGVGELTEENYYKDYQKSAFGITMKKAGWDCQRHYEIVFNQCLPYFWDIDKCPPRTLANWPKPLLREILNIQGVTYDKVDEAAFDQTAYKELMHELSDYAMKNFTTVASAKYILSHL